MNKKALLQALLFVAEKPLPLQQLCRLAELGEDEARKLLQELQQESSLEKSGVELVETPEGFEFRVKPEYREKASRIAPFADLSGGMLRTLSLVILKQPVLQSEIVKYQGNRAYEYLRALEQKGLVRTQKAKRTKVVFVSSELEKYFGKSLSEIKESLSKEIS